MIHRSLAEYVATHPEQVLPIVAGLLAALAHYRRTGRLPLGRLPLRNLKAAWGDLADQYFGAPRPRGVPGLLVETDAATLEATLRERYFEGVDDYSYEYAGEVLNLRRPAGTRPHPETGEAVPMELHPRAFETESGDLLVLAHAEASRYEAWDAHLDETVLSWERGREAFATVLEGQSIPHERIASERAANVTVTS